LRDPVEPNSSCDGKTVECCGAVDHAPPRPVQAEDWVVVHEWASTEVAGRYQPWGPSTVEDTQSFVSEAVAAWNRSRQDRYVWTAVDGATVVGLGGLQVRNRRWHQGELAYAVHTKRWGTGVATAIGQQSWTSHLATRAASSRGTLRSTQRRLASVLNKFGHDLGGTVGPKDRAPYNDALGARAKGSGRRPKPASVGHVQYG
jgi:hypothetical protein